MSYPLKEYSQLVNPDFPSIAASLPDNVNKNNPEFRVHPNELQSRMKKEAVKIILPVNKAQIEYVILIFLLFSGVCGYYILHKKIKQLQSELDAERNKKRFVEHFSTYPKIQSENLTTDNTDAEFINNAIRIVEENISDPSLDVEKFSKLMGVSRSQLQRKLKIFTNDTPQSLIRSLRLSHAAKLLKESQLSVTEICYKAGFNYPAHFSQHFQLKFGSTPREYRKRYRHQKINLINTKLSA